jgi:hypothetical protein
MSGAVEVEMCERVEDEGGRELSVNVPMNVYISLIGASAKKGTHSSIKMK